MVTKEQCLINAIFDRMGKDENLIRYVLSIYNQGKEYAGEQVFPNTLEGFYQALKGRGEGGICKVFYETLGDFETDAPFFTFSYKFNSIWPDDFKGMLTNQDISKLLCNDILGELDEEYIMNEIFVEEFIWNNYRDLYGSNIDIVEVLYNMGYRSGYDLLRVDWNQLAKSIEQYSQQMNENTIKLTGDDLRGMTNKILKEIRKRNK